MLFLLPPSETKRPGGTAPQLDVSGLMLPALTPQREAVTTALESLSADPEAAARVLKLGRTQLGDVAVNAALRSSPTMAAIDRYTGVLYDALDAADMDAAARRWLGAHIMIHSAPFGPVGALDRIPAYRLAAGTSLPGLAPLRRIWADAVTAALAARAPAGIVDLRSEAYAALGPVPSSVPSVFVRVVVDAAHGEVRALNHFNKHAKGAFVRALAQARPRLRTLGALRRWSADAGWDLRDAGAGEWHLVIDA